VTIFDDPLPSQRIRTGQIARMPILLGSLEDHGTVFALAELDASQNISTYIGPLGDLPPPTVVQALYPSLNNAAAVGRDVISRWCVIGWSQWKNNKNLTNAKTAQQKCAATRLYRAESRVCTGTCMIHPAVLDST
jgi:hypothetical protein